MIVRVIDEIMGTDREITADNGNWLSRRMLLKKDGMGFSFHETIIFPETETHIWYKNHLEAVYCIEGEGEIETVSDGRKYGIMPGVLYALDKNDEHWLRCTKKMRLVCVFVPPLTGSEKHDSNGSYAVLEG